VDVRGRLAPFQRQPFMELEPMKDAIESAINALAKKAEAAEKPDDAMKFAQAATNLASALATFQNIGK
jgi:hypothetical protein